MNTDGHGFSETPNTNSENQIFIRELRIFSRISKARTVIGEKTVALDFFSPERGRFSSVTRAKGSKHGLTRMALKLGP